MYVAFPQNPRPRSVERQGKLLWALLLTETGVHESVGGGRRRCAWNTNGMVSPRAARFVHQYFQERCSTTSRRHADGYGGSDTMIRVGAIHAEIRWGGGGAESVWIWAGGAVNFSARVGCAHVFSLPLQPSRAIEAPYWDKRTVAAKPSRSTSCEGLVHATVVRSRWRGQDGVGSAVRM